MKIDISKVSLLEKDIEDWLYENPTAMYVSRWTLPITQWIGRQYVLPSGIADLIGLREDKRLVVVEVKNVPLNKAAVLQVCRYQNDLKHIVSNRMEYPHFRDMNEPLVDMVLIGPSIDNQTFTEARAVGVEVLTFDVSLKLDISGLSWAREYRDQLHDQQVSIASQQEWAIFGLTIAEDIEQHRLERQRESQLDFTVEQVTDEYDDLMDAITKDSSEATEGDKAEQ